MQNIIEDEIVKAAMQDGISQVDENLIIDDFECAFETQTRKLRVHFTAKNKATAETVTIDNVI